MIIKLSDSDTLRRPFRLWEEAFFHSKELAGFLFSKGLENITMEDLLTNHYALKGLSIQEKQVLQQNIGVAQLLVFLPMGIKDEPEYDDISLNKALLDVLRKITIDDTTLAHEIINTFSDIKLEDDIFDDYASVEYLIHGMLRKRQKSAYENLVFEFVTHKGFAPYKNDVNIARRILSDFGEYLEDFSKEIRDNKELVLLAVKSHPASYVAASLRLQQDVEVFTLRNSKKGSQSNFSNPSYE